MYGSFRVAFVSVFSFHLAIFSFSFPDSFFAEDFWMDLQLVNNECSFRFGRSTTNFANLLGRSGATERIVPTLAVLPSQTSDRFVFHVRYLGTSKRHDLKFPCWLRIEVMVVRASAAEHSATIYL